MKKLWGNGGIVLFWLCWPFWLVYFRFNKLRSRIVVVCEEEILLIEGWVRSHYEMSLPGGGVKKSESVTAAAIRELEEETGIQVLESSLKRLGARVHRQYGLKYHARFFSVELAAKPELRLRGPKILTAQWVSWDELNRYTLDADTRYAVRRYQPTSQTRLL